MQEAKLHSENRADLMYQKNPKAAFIIIQRFNQHQATEFRDIIREENIQGTMFPKAIISKYFITSIRTIPIPVNQAIDSMFQKQQIPKREKIK